MIEILNDLYNSEINFALSTFWDCGFDWALGDKINGFKAHGNTDTLEEAILALKEAAIEHYPLSTFTKVPRVL